MLLKNQPCLQRSRGTGSISFKPGLALAGSGLSTRLERLYQHGNARIKLPRVHGNFAEAVLINTAGGLTGGDSLKWSITAGEKTTCVVTTQACEKIYRALSKQTKITTRIKIGKGARVDWLPQETIIYDRSGLDRELQVDMNETARFLAVEAVILGRRAMGETVKATRLHDRWRITKAGKLVHGEDFQLKGDVERQIANPALLNGNTAFASLVYVGPESQEEMQLMAKDLTARTNITSGISVFNGKIVLRIVALDGYLLRKKIIPVLNCLRKTNLLPKVWSL